MRKFTVCNFEETRQLCVNFFCQGNYNDDGDNDDVEEEEEGIMIVKKDGHDHYDEEGK